MPVVGHERAGEGVRKMKHNMMATANALAIVTAVVYVVCRVAFLVAPELSMAVVQSWFHGFSISTLAAPTVTTESFVLGFVTSAGAAWLVGYFFVWTYNKLAR